MNLFLQFDKQTADAGTPETYECAHGSCSVLYFIL